MSSAHSENRLSTEISRLRQEIAETRADMGELRAEQSSMQTRWILAAMLAASVLFPVVSQIVSCSAQLFASTIK